MCGITFIGEQSYKLGGGWKTSYCRTCPYVVDVCAIHTGRWGGRFDGLYLKMAMLDFSMKKMTADSEVNGMKPGSTHGLLGNSCQGEDVGVLSGLNYAIYQHCIGCETT